MNTYTQDVAGNFETTARNYMALIDMADALTGIALKVTQRMRIGGCVYFCGNGGSAADAQHLAAELQGRFLHDRTPFASVALGTNSSSITAIGNDYHFDEIFSRQLLGLGRANDVLIALSTSGNSRNIIRAIEVARDLRIYALGLTGQGGGAMASICDDCLKVPSDHTARIQEMHIGIGHSLCEIVERELM